MFDLQNILAYANSNIQIIGVFIAIIGGIIATRLINTKIEKDTLIEKLERINKEISFNTSKKESQENKIYQKNREDFIYEVYEKVIEKDFDMSEYNDYGLTEQQRLDIIEEIKYIIKDALILFQKEHKTSEVDEILKKNHIKENTVEHSIYSFVGYETGSTTNINTTFGLIPDLADVRFRGHLTTLQENLEERDMNNNLTELTDFIKWKQIEKEDIEAKLVAISENLKVKNDVILFILITIFAIIIPQIILSIYPLFYGYRWLKYIFAIYSIISFIISMTLLLGYVYKLFVNVSKNIQGGKK